MTALEALQHAIEAHQDMWELHKEEIFEYTEAHKEAFIELYDAYRELTTPDSYSVNMYREFTDELW